MGSAPWILVLDDGDLLRVRNAIAEIGVVFEHRMWADLQQGVFLPRQLLVTSPRYATEVSKLVKSGGRRTLPIWVCAHGQDFLPFRERLRGLGVHYLISSRLHPEAMRLFFLQVLYGGRERRHNERLLVSCELAYWLGGKWEDGRLQELSRRGCRVLANERAMPGSSAVVRLPTDVAGGSDLTLTGCVTHCTSEAKRSGGEGYSLIVVFEGLERQAHLRLKSILDGRNLGTRITPLGLPPPRPDDAPEQPGEKAKARKRTAAAKPAKTTKPPKPAKRRKAAKPRKRAASQNPLALPELEIEPELPPKDRRSQPRREYMRKLITLNADAEEAVLGRDLSLEGVRLDRHQGLAVGTPISLAIYGGRREEPRIFDARVVWKHPTGGAGLRFDPMTPEERAWLEELIESLPLVESLDDIRPDGERIVISKLVRERS
ncbi:MAG: PilZ domain-containing protein [Myxococcota bacterium]